MYFDFTFLGLHIVFELTIKREQSMFVAACPRCVYHYSSDKSKAEATGMIEKHIRMKHVTHSGSLTEVAVKNLKQKIQVRKRVVS